MAQPSRNRRNVALVVAIVGGLLLGVFIKRVHIGLLIGLAIGLLVSGLIRRR
ncbi:MAG TPA: hypothetical protein VD993_05995 [Chitinophagaceae bacterium]|nr:hypothetical protein [Chitinophagaceae bacterium]